MKQVILLLIVFLIFGFKNNDDEITLITSKFTQEIKYVTAKSGLIYRDKPKGKRLGKFEFNEKILIIEHTNIFQEIRDGNKTIKGEWLATSVANKKVYIFDGFLSDAKVKITSDDVKRFMGNYVWFSKDFKNVLEDTKLLSKASNYGGFVNIFYWEDKLYCHTKYSANDEICDTNKIIQINNRSFTLKYNQKIFVFEKTKVTVDYEGYLFDPPIKCTDQVFEEWFFGNYIFKNENRTKKYSSKHISYYLFWEADVIRINNKIYEIDKVNGNTYYLSEIEFVGEEGDEEIKKIGTKATLTKI